MSGQIELRVSADSATAMDGASLSVTTTAPDVELTGALTATAGVPFTIKVGADDPSSADMASDFVYTDDWGDGAPATPSPVRPIRR